MALRILTFVISMATAVVVPLFANAAGGTKTIVSESNNIVVSQACDPSADIRFLTPRTNIVFQRGFSWKSCRGDTFILQKDGNLVVYDSKKRPIWQSRTVGKARKLVWQTDGNLVLYNRKNRPVWSSKTAGRGARLVIQSDGNIVIYSIGNRPLWSTGTDRG